jgi:hypothetical protein
MRDAVTTLTAIHTTKHADNAALGRALKSWPQRTIAGRSLTFAEALLNAATSELVARAVAPAPAWATSLLSAASEGVMYGPDAEVRAWTTRSLWRLLTHYRTLNVLPDDVRNAGGFDGYVLRGFILPAASAAAAAAASGAVVLTSGPPRALAPPVGRLELPVYRALMEILLDGVAKPSDPPSVVEPFGKLVSKPALLRLIFRLLPSADWSVKHDVMKDMNVLLVKREENFPFILEQAEWMSWLCPLLAGLPRKGEDRNELQNEYVKYVMNFFVMVLAYAYGNAGVAGGDIEKQLNRFLAQMALQCGWTDAVVGVARALLSSLMVKIAAGCKRWSRRYDRAEWENAFKVATVVEDFVFYRPVGDDNTGSAMAEAMAEQAAGGVPQLLYVSPGLLQPGVTQPLAPVNVEAPAKDTPGLHLNLATVRAR